MKIVHVIPGLEAGGAETALFRLLNSLRGSEVQSAVISLTESGDFGESIEALGVPLVCLKMRRGQPTPTGLLRLRRSVQQLQPDLLQGWMYHGNLAALGACQLAGTKRPVLWNIRHSLDDLKGETFSLKFMIAAGRYFSRKATRIIYNSQRSARQHEDYGYDPARSAVIPNGFDIELFRPRPEAGQAVRQELGIGAEAIVIGMIARFQPVKGHAVFLRSAALLAQRWPQVRFVLAGKGIETGNRQLCAQIAASGLGERIVLAGERRDLATFLNGIDLVTLTSHSEAFPNVLGEAMATAIPCVTTDVGDAAWLVGNSGTVVPPGDVAAIVHAWDAFLSMNREQRRDLGALARSRVVSHYSLEAVVGQYLQCYQQYATLGEVN